MELKALKCPNCGGRVTKGDGNGYFTCCHCDSLLFSNDITFKLGIKEIKRQPKVSSEFKKKKDIYKYVLFGALVVGIVTYLCGVIPEGRWDNKTNILFQIIGAFFVCTSVLVYLKQMRFNNFNLDIGALVFAVTIIFAIFNFTSDYKSSGNWLTFATIGTFVIFLVFLTLGIISIASRPIEKREV